MELALLSKVDKFPICTHKKREGRWNAGIVTGTGWFGARFTRNGSGVLFAVEKRRTIRKAGNHDSRKISGDYVT